jgi:hypothetical protein
MFDSLKEILVLSRNCCLLGKIDVGLDVDVSTATAAVLADLTHVLSGVLASIFGGYVSLERVLPRV